MYFDLKTFARVKAHQATHGAGTATWLLTAWQLCSLPLIHFSFRLDRWLHPEIERLPVRAPLFVTGNPRSGTTLLLDLLDHDPANACYSTYELGLPSPTLRRLIPASFHQWAAGQLDRRFESIQHIHPVGLDRPEEDEMLFMLLGNCGLIEWLFPCGPGLEDLRLSRFWEWPEAKRDRFGAFLHGCIQRLLWSRGSSRYVSKSPHFAGKIDDLRRWYPDARFVYLVRSPLETIPSALSMVCGLWALSAPGRRPTAEALESVYRGLVALYRQADQSLRRLPPESHLVVRYPDLMAQPLSTLETIYEKFSLPWAPELSSAMEVRLKSLESRPHAHRYQLGDFGISRERIERDLGFILDRYQLGACAS